MSDEQKPKTVTVTAVQAHTYDGKRYDEGDTYEIAADLAESIVVQGKAVLGKAVKKDATAADAKAPYQRKDLKA
jgi:hypothetical protein